LNRSDPPTARQQKSSAKKKILVPLRQKSLAFSGGLQNMKSVILRQQLALLSTVPRCSYDRKYDAHFLVSPEGKGVFVNVWLFYEAIGGCPTMRKEVAIAAGADNPRVIFGLPGVSQKRRRYWIFHLTTMIKRCEELRAIHGDCNGKDVLKRIPRRALRTLDTELLSPPGTNFRSWLAHFFGETDLSLLYKTRYFAYNTSDQFARTAQSALSEGSPEV